MKSKKKFLSLLVFAPLLVGCGNKVQAPKFAEYGKKMASYEAFKAEVFKQLEKASFSKAAKFGSFELKNKMSELDNEIKIERDKKEIDKRGTFSTGSGVTRFSVDDLVLSSESESSSTYTAEDGNQKQSSVGKSKTNSQFQVGKVKNKEHILIVDLVNKQYTSYTEIGSKKAKEIFDEQAKDIVYQSLKSEMETFMSSYESSWGDEMKSHCKFYKNDKIYTAEIIHEEKDNTSEYADYKCNYKYTVQVDFTEGNWSSKSFEEDVTVDTYKKNQVTRVKGDVVTTTTSSSKEVSVKTKKVSLKKADLSKFTSIFME